jgi:hypothetical protein
VSDLGQAIRDHRAETPADRQLRLTKALKPAAVETGVKK